MKQARQQNMIYTFTQVYVSTLFLLDAFNSSERYVKHTNIIGTGSSQYYPLNFDEFNVELSASFVKLHDKTQFLQKLSTQVKKNKKIFYGRRHKRISLPVITKNVTQEIAAQRANTKIINRFAIHGKTASIKRFFSHAISMLVLLSQFFTLTAACDYTLFSSTVTLNECCKINKTFFKTVTSLFSTRDLYDKQLCTSAELGSYRANIYNTEFLFNRLRALSPMYSTLPKRVDKARYKNMRGKLSKYTLKISKIPRAKSVVYGLFYLKMQWTFSEQRTATDRFVRVLATLLFNPRGTLGYVVGKKVIQKLLER